jgi:hypothetical protein
VIARVSYSYNSILEDAGQPGYFFDCLVLKDGQTVVDTHQTFRTRSEFYGAIEGVIPVLDPLPEGART